MKILFLATDAHGGFGGVSQYNRDILEALSRWSAVERVEVLVRLMGDTNIAPPPKISYLCTGDSGIVPFVLKTGRAAISGAYDLVYCAHINLLPAAYLAARVARCPIVLAIYGIDAWSTPGGMSAYLAKRNDVGLLSISAVTARRFCIWSGRSLEKIAILPNAIRPEDYGTGPKASYLIERYSIQGRTVIMTFGRMPSADRQKGFDETLDAVAHLRKELPDLVYLLVGDGPDRTRLEQKAQALGIGDSVRFTGRIAEEEKADHYRLCDAYVMPSTGEGFGFVVTEALACGIPVVASTTDGTFEAVRNGALGQVVDPTDQAGLIAAIKAALAQEKRVPEGLSYFEFPEFDKRLYRALLTVDEASPRGTKVT